jgi:hypothetical protein
LPYLFELATKHPLLIEQLLTSHNETPTGSTAARHWRISVTILPDCSQLIDGPSGNA